MEKLNFVADVGGTNIRLALIDNGNLVGIRKYLCKDFATITDAIHQFREDSNVEAFDAGCIGIACPVDKDLVKMTNHDWEFSKKELKESLGLSSLFVINDFTAVAFSLPQLGRNQLIKIGGGEPVENGNIAVFGPGTGLGVEHLTWTPLGWQTLDGEGGHVDFAPNDDTDIVIWHYLHKKHGRVSAEEVLSGRGIVNIYRALCEDTHNHPRFSDPATITQAALDKSDDLADRTMQQFCRAMGAFAGNLALNLCTSGGIFIGGGVTTKLGQYFVESDFRKYFEAKGNFAHYVKPIPTYIIDEPEHGLIGSLAFLNQQTKRTHDE